MRAITVRKVFANLIVKTPFTLWVRYGDHQPFSLEFKTGNVDKLKNVVRRRIFSDMNKGKIILRKHESTVDLEPDVIVDESFRNTVQTPLQIGKPLRQHECARIIF